MIFTRENCKPVFAPGARKLALDLSRTKQSFANLAAEDGSFIQVAGGPGLFLLERKEPSGSHSRAYQDHPVAIHADGTLLQSSAGNFNLAQDEWFLLRQVVEIFEAFSNGQPMPPYVRWRELGYNYAVKV